MSFSPCVAVAYIVQVPQDPSVEDHLQKTLSGSVVLIRQDPHDTRLISRDSLVVLLYGSGFLNVSALSPRINTLRSRLHFYHLVCT